MRTDQPEGYRQRILSSLAWQGSAQFLGQLASWASTIFVIRILTPDDYGLMAMAMVLVSFLLMLSDLGIGAAIVQAPELDAEDLCVVQGFVFLFYGTGLILTWGLSPLVAAFFEEPELLPVIWVLGGNFLLLSLYVVPRSRLIRDLRFDQKARVDLVTLVVSALATLFLAWRGLGVWALVAGTALSHLLRAIGFNWVMRDFVRPHFSYERGRRFLAFGSVIVLDRFLWFLYSNLDVTIAGKLLGAELLGFYSVALTLAAIPLDKVMPVLTQVAFPAVSRIQDEPERVRHNVLRGLRYGNLVFLPVFWGMAWVGGDALPLILGTGWIPAVLPFQLICAILPLKALGALLPPALFGVGRPGVNVANMAISLALLSVGFLVGAQYGLVGLAASWAVVYPVVFVITVSRALPVLGLRWRDVLKAWRGALLAAAFMSGAVGATIFLGAAWGALPRLVVSIAVGAVAYVGAVVIVDRSAIRELREIVTR